MLLTLSMIVKNEARTLARTLESAKPFIDRWVILDTGSTDGTQDLIRKTLEGIPGELHEEPFVDFATSRNRALDLAGTKTEFVLWLDADDRLEGGAALREFLENTQDDAFFVRVAMGISFDSPRIARTRAGWRFEGVVHEVLVCPDKPPPARRVPGVVVHHEASSESAERSKKRWERDAVLLEAALARTPNHTRTTFYLAKTYHWLGRLDEAEVMFQKRIALGGWYEEVYDSKVELARIAESRGSSWPEIQMRWLDAHSFSPHRAESLFWIASYYRRIENHALTFFFARRAFELPLPKDKLFVNEDIYNWRAADLTAIAAWYLGEYEIGEAAARKALAANPGNPQMARNLRFFTDRKSPSPDLRFHSQAGQDRHVFETYFRHKRGGVFVDVGAYDGEKFSNTKFFEDHLGWTGLCIEPLPSAFDKLVACRTSPDVRCIRCAVSDYEGEGDFLDVDVTVDDKMLSGLVENYDERHVRRITGVKTNEKHIKTAVRTLNAICEEAGLREIDYCTIDTEGSELKILEAFDFKRFPVKAFSVENNYHDSRIPALMRANGYDLVHVFEGFDELYVRRDFLKPVAKTTAICAVWHGDPKRTELLRGHQATLDRQTVPVDRVYVFDNGDVPPANIKGRVLVSNKPLTIYEAWKLALSAVKTPYVMNLNLDDRLAPDAVELLENTLEQDQALIVGGDWQVCYDQPQTDATEPTFDVAKLPFVKTWPPPKGTPTRLGTGTGDRGGLGPAVLWRMDVPAPFPTHFGDGTTIRVIGDWIWWNLLGALKPPVRVARVIGNYHSHPSEQAEFRSAGPTRDLVHEEHASFERFGVR